MRGAFLVLWLLLLLPPSALAGEAGCRILLRHVPDADVAYRPGVDVHGRPVAPADLSPRPRLQAPRVVLIDLSVPLSVFRDRHDHRWRRSFRYDKADILLGTVAVDLASRAVWFNDIELTGAETRDLVAWCRRSAGGLPLPAHKPAPK